jgi:hypothetical protein
MDVVGDCGAEHTFGTPMCFDDTMPGPPGAMVKGEAGKGEADFLVSISSGGWFQPVQLEQHF